MGHLLYILFIFNLIFNNSLISAQSSNNDEDFKSEKIVTDQNAKPRFVSCENNNASVQEEQHPGTLVTTVMAEDTDPAESGGTVTYKIVKLEGERSFFQIDNRTGRITTTIAFDRDEPNRQKELYLTVQATDNGRPPLADICTFKVTVTDINDNQPSFDQSAYNVQVAEDLKKDREVASIFAYDIDDGDNSKLTYSFKNYDNDFINYFRIDQKTGVIYLEKELKTRDINNDQFRAEIQVVDNGDPPLSSTAEIIITVVGSDKQPPRIKSVTPSNLTLKENFHDFDNVLFTIVAESGIQDESLVFELIKGKTAQTNKGDTFQLTPNKNDLTSAFIKLIRFLDYETVIEYTLTVRVTNKESMDASINIPVYIEDVNDETPSFIDTIRGSVVENDDPGALAMQVRAIDKDGTVANNIVSYELLSHTDKFSIDKNTGVIKSLVEFDREQEALYHVRVKAYDNSPSALKPNSNEPNTAIQAFQISIEDRNDNKPQFTKSIYYIYNVSELSDIKKDVGEVKALDADTASLIIYSIISGNTDDVFSIENTTGRIKVNKQLDYEKVEQYDLTVKAFDGIYDDKAQVIIYIENENDEPPVFSNHSKQISLKEESLVDGCIMTVSAYDPDIKDRHADQHITYVIEGDFLHVEKDGCITLVKKLDRDPPYGVARRQVFIYAYDNDAAPNSLKTATEIEIVLEDINDNAPFLNVTEYVWDERRSPGIIGQLSADDYDTPQNGPPFTYEIDTSASEDIFNKFSIIDGNSLKALVIFDREEKKYYDIPIKITDSGTPRLSGISILRVIIGDINDNPASDGESEIFVYTHDHLNSDIQIGRVYVNDLDDWDINDKEFIQKTYNEYFYLNNNPGMIMMRPQVPEGVHELKFEVEERETAYFSAHKVNADVKITVKHIPDIAIKKSGSIRLKGATVEEFVEKTSKSNSSKEILQSELAKMLNTSVENVDVMTIVPSPTNNSLVDVRFSAHGSPYYEKEKLNNKITEYQDKLENLLNVEFVMININECFNESVCISGYSCSNYLHIYDEPAVVFTNKTSFVGVKALAEKKCDCSSAYEPIVECYNGGSLIEGSICNCPPGYDGPHCELTSVGFYEEGSWAMYPTFSACNKTDITLTISPLTENGLIFYVGPLTIKHARTYKDFMSLELINGYLVLKMNLGNNTIETVSDSLKIESGSKHVIRISYGTDSVEMEVDECKSKCLKLTNFDKTGLLNVNGPLQLGRMRYSFNTEESKMIWGREPPINKNFIGCINNFTYNDYVYNLGQPSDQYKAAPGCTPNGVIAAVTFGIDSNFLVAILVCIALLLILLLAVVVHRRKHDNYHEKDIDDTRANIINYEDEGGGECDTNYDLSVFRSNYNDEKPILKDNPDVNADISGFLDNKKDNCDKNPDNLPYDDVRHYAYEGDGNSTGSLSSLASCTDEGDLKFNYLSSFGPRFRKLADMYGEDPSDEDSHDGGEESWC